MRTTFGALLCALSLLAAQHATAQTVTYLHQGKPLFDVTYPDGWKVEFLAPSTPDGARTLAAGPRDRFVWVGFWAESGATSLDAAKDRLQAVAETVIQDAKLVGKSEASTVNGMPVRYFRGTGTYVSKRSERGPRPVEFVAMLFQPKPDAYCVGVYLGPPDAMTVVKPALDAMVASLRPATR